MSVEQTTPPAPPPAAPATAPEPTRRAQLVGLLTTGWIYLALGLIVLAFSIWGGSAFLAVTNFKDILYNSSEIVLLAVGVAFLIIAGHLDLSLGSVLVFASVVGAKTMGALSGSAAQTAVGIYPHAGVGIAVGIVVCVLAGTAWGLFNGLCVTRLKMPSFIVTLGSLGMALGLAEVITRGTNVSTVPPQIQSDLGAREVAGVPVLVIVSAAITLVAGFALAKTRFGLATYAIGSNNEGARRAGIAVDRHVVKLFVLAGTLAGLAGAYDVARFNTTAVQGHTTDALTAIAAVVIGGASLFGGSGTIALTAIGVLIPAVLQNGFVIVNVQPFWADVAIGAVLIVAVAIDQARRRGLSSGR
jgi:ribose transport system permease protein